MLFRWRTWTWSNCNSPASDEAWKPVTAELQQAIVFGRRERRDYAILWVFILIGGVTVAWAIVGALAPARYPI